MSNRQPRPVLKPSQVLRLSKANKLPQHIKYGHLQCPACYHVDLRTSTECPAFWENGMYISCPNCDKNIIPVVIFPPCEGYPEGFEIDLTGERKKYPPVQPDAALILPPLRPTENTVIEAEEEYEYHVRYSFGDRGETQQYAIAKIVSKVADLTDDEIQMRVNRVVHNDWPDMIHRGWWYDRDEIKIFKVTRTFYKKHTSTGGTET